VPKYSLTFTASQADAKAMLDLAVKALTAQELNELHFSQIEADDVRPPAAPKPVQRHKPRTEGSNGAKTVIDLLKDAPQGRLTRDSLARKLHQRGYAPASIGPFASICKRLDLVEFNHPYYQLTPAGRDSEIIPRIPRKEPA
jgi:hypothetical protein